MTFLILIFFVSIATANHDLYNALQSDLGNTSPSKQTTYPRYQPISEKQIIYPSYKSYARSVPMIPRAIYQSNNVRLYEPSFNTLPPQNQAYQSFARSVPMIPKPISPSNNVRLYEPSFHTHAQQPPQNQLMNQLLQKRMLNKFSDNILGQSDADLQKKYLNQLVWMVRSGMFKPNNGLSNMFPVMQMDLFGEDNDITGLLPLMQMGLLAQKNPIRNVPSEYSSTDNHYHAPSFPNTPRAIYSSNVNGNSFSATPTQPPQNQWMNQLLQQRMLTKFSDNILSQSDADLQKKHLDQLIWMMRTGMFKSNNGISNMLPMMDLFGDDSEMFQIFPLMQMGLLG